MKGSILTVPKTLPQDLAKTAVLEGASESEAKNQATQIAQHMLYTQKQKTGVAILGKPQNALHTDPKYQGDFRRDSTLIGERLAEASLTIEITTLILAKIPQNKWKPYLGRAQYPRIQLKKAQVQLPEPLNEIDKFVIDICCTVRMIKQVYQQNSTLTHSERCKVKHTL